MNLNLLTSSQIVFELYENLMNMLMSQVEIADEFKVSSIIKEVLQIHYATKSSARAQKLVKGPKRAVSGILSRWGHNRKDNGISYGHT